MAAHEFPPAGGHATPDLRRKCSPNIPRAPRNNNPRPPSGQIRGFDGQSLGPGINLITLVVEAPEAKLVQLQLRDLGGESEHAEPAETIPGSLERTYRTTGLYLGWILPKHQTLGVRSDAR